MESVRLNVGGFVLPQPEDWDKAERHSGEVLSLKAEVHPNVVGRFDAWPHTYWVVYPDGTPPEMYAAGAAGVGAMIAEELERNPQRGR